jgi:hypothetical protein
MATQLRCESGEWKARDQFSRNQLEKFDTQARRGNATPSRTGIRCVAHSQKQALEMRCKGPCNRWRELRFFSKNTRRNGKNVSLAALCPFQTHVSNGTIQWCIDCTDWQTKTENGETLPAPGGQLSVEETQARLPHPAYLRDDMILEEDVLGFDDVEVRVSSRTDLLN